jgi:hypothetical protein
VRAAAALTEAPPRRHRRPGIDCAGGSGKLEQRERAAADLGYGLDDARPAADRRAHQPRPGPQVLASGGEHPEDGNLRAGELGVAVEAQRRRQRGKRELVDPHGPGERMGSAGLDRVAPADQHPGLRAPEQLVAREAHDRAARGDRAGHGRLAGQRGQAARERARADVVDDRHPQPAQILGRDLLGEADHAVVGRMGAQDRAGLRPHRALVVAEPSAIGGADLHQLGAGLLNHLRQAERAADLDQLSAGDHDLTPGAERGRGQQHRGRPVVHRQGGLGAAQLAQEALDVGLARATFAAFEVVLEIRVGAPGASHGLGGALGQRRPSEVRVHDHAGRVQHRPRPR